MEGAYKLTGLSFVCILWIRNTTLVAFEKNVKSRWPEVRMRGPEVPLFQ